MRHVLHEAAQPGYESLSDRGRRLVLYWLIVASSCIHAKPKLRVEMLPLG